MEVGCSSAGGHVSLLRLALHCNLQYHIEMLQPGPFPSPLIACHHPGGITRRSPGYRIVSMACGQTCLANEGCSSMSFALSYPSRRSGYVEVLLMYAAARSDCPASSGSCDSSLARLCGDI